MYRFFFPIIAVVGFCVAVAFSEELLARCRCDRGERGSRRQARMERRAARRGESCESYVPYSPDQGTGYPDAVQPLGAANTDQPRFRWVCEGGRCRLVPIATPDATFQVSTQPKATDPPKAKETPGSAIQTFD